MALPAAVERSPLGRPVTAVLGPAADDPEPRISAGLCRALCHGAIDEFVREVDVMVGGPVALLGRDGEVVALSREGTPRHAARARLLVLQDGGDVLGSLELPPGSPWCPEQDRLLRDVGAAMLRQRRRHDEVRQLRHRLSLLSWLSAHPELAPLASWPPSTEPGTCRPVVAVAAGHGEYASIARRLTDVCAGEPLLAGLSLVPADDALLGLYQSEAGSHPQEHARTWSRVLDSARIGSLTVAIGRPTPPGAALQESYLQVRHLATLQRDRTGYLELPAVAVTDELGPMADVLTAVSAGQVAPFVERVLGDLVTDSRFGGQLVETLYAYLTTGGSPQEAGRLLHLHPSSVKYRIRVIRGLLGARLDDPAQRFDLELAVRLHLAARQLRERCVEVART